MKEDLSLLLNEIKACRVCEASLPLGPRPVLVANASAKILIVGQAPGIRVHESGIAWDDQSGNRLRDWMGITTEDFYDETKVAIVPMGFCYPGTQNGGDLPPRKECAEHWHERLMAQLIDIKLTLVIGRYAQGYLLGQRNKTNLTKTVEAWKEYRPKYIPLPHPSPRNHRWLKKNAWFVDEVIPYLRQRVRRVLR